MLGIQASGTRGVILCVRTKRFTHRNQIDRVSTKVVPLGMHISPEIRRAIDVYAMRKAEEYFRSAGYETKDVHKNRPFDLLCSRGSVRLFVEVKGTRSKEEQVILTSGEVKFAKKDPMHMVLYVQRLVRVTYGNGQPVVSGDKRLVKRQWTVDERSLEPLCFTYKLKR